MNAATFPLGSRANRGRRGAARRLRCSAHAPLAGLRIRPGPRRVWRQRRRRSMRDVRRLPGSCAHATARAGAHPRADTEPHPGARAPRATRAARARELSRAVPRRDRRRSMCVVVLRGHPARSDGRHRVHLHRGPHRGRHRPLRPARLPLVTSMPEGPATARGATPRSDEGASRPHAACAAWAYRRGRARARARR